ncbi:MAG TPA: Ppx/GppA phosphatase family protein [Pirellulales bacterium]|jgi:exopolyphosphatase/guanosine-5'-triphosphate,3'-diphosphate pyrophosphatase|nr:Ppx/GppA phosphatase family protein [Pirellulales bacterium]
MEDQRFLSPELSHRLAAIDIGTNSLRLIIAESMRAGNYRILDEEKVTTRLGKGLGETGRLNPEAVEQSLEALRSMKQIAEGFQVSELRVIATCAVREATDGPEFVRRARDEIGLEVEVISGYREAHLAFLSVMRNFNLEGKNVVVADIGGGSTELVFASGNIIEAVCPTPLGAVRMTERFDSAGALDAGPFQAMLDGIDRELRRNTKHVLLEPHVLIGSGGTFTTLAEMILATRGQTGLPLRGAEVTRAEVRHLLDRLRKLPADARRGMPGLSVDRADIILAGVAIVDRIMHHFDLNRALIHDRGVRDGLLLTMLEHAPHVEPETASDRDAAVERFARNCSVDLPHARHVTRLAGQMFSQLIEFGRLNVNDRPLLEAAARLQDVGYLIDYEKHHKHSYYLILNSRLAGFQPHELELVANIARYHRGAEPKKKHENFCQLSSDDRARVRKLAAILRLAGGLDRANTQQVQDVSIEARDGEVRMHVIAPQKPEVDLWSAHKRAAPFERAFDAKLSIDWQPPAAEAEHAAG